jgi:hypothetical protein
MFCRQVPIEIYAFAEKWPYSVDTVYVAAVASEFSGWHSSKFAERAVEMIFIIEPNRFVTFLIREF